jgi:hypothetical protein
MSSFPFPASQSNVIALPNQIQLSQVVSSVHSLRAGQTECLSFRQGLSTSENSHRMSRLVTVADWSWVVGTLRGSGFDFFFQVAREIS